MGALGTGDLRSVTVGEAAGAWNQPRCDGKEIKIVYRKWREESR